MIEDDYRDFRVYQLEDSGEKTELPEIGVEKTSDLFTSEGVLLLVRYDIRRIFIWKGPRAPVRKRFISSRVSAGIQSECGDNGMHMKVISVDAGDEPIEFLKAFNVDPYEVEGEEKPQDMYYIRNSERTELEDKELKEKLAKKKKSKEKEGYWSPALDGNVKFGEEKVKAKAKAASSVQSRTAPIKRSATIRSAPKKVVGDSLSEDERNKIKETILQSDIPDGFERLNIIIGTALYGPQKLVSKVFGKEVEETKWDEIGNVPEGMIDIDAEIIQALCEGNKVKGLVVLKKASEKSDIQPDCAEDTPKKKTKEEAKKEPKKDNKPKIRELKPIPKGTKN